MVVWITKNVGTCFSFDFGGKLFWGSIKRFNSFDERVKPVKG